jgi:tetratricopeptide (TPR) repeat protein
VKPPSEPPAHSDLDPARALARDGRFDDAIAAVSALVGPARPRGSRQGALASALADVARLAARAGNTGAEERALATAVRVAPGYADLRYHYARALIAHQRRADARRELETALRLNPDYVAARLEIALLNAREGLLAEALDSLRDLSDDRRVVEPGALRRGIESLQIADWDEAEVLFRQALRLADAAVEEIVSAYHERMGEGDVEGAIRMLRAAIGTRETYADLHHLLGVAELEAGAYDDALASTARALELQPDFHDARVAFARVLEAFGDVAQASEQVALVLRQEPDHAQALALQERWSRRRRRGTADFTAA